MEFYHNKFKEIRKKQNLSLQSIVKRMYKSYKTVWSWEKGEHKPKREDIKQLASILGVEVNEISDIQLDNNNYLSYNSGDFFISDRILSELPYIQLLKDEVIRLNRQLHLQNRMVNNVNNLLDSLQSLFYTKNSELRYTYINNAFALAVGNSKNEIIGRKSHEILIYPDAITLNKLEQEVLTSGVSIKNKEIFIPGTNKTKFGLISIYPEYENNKIASLNCCIRDITDRKTAIMEIDRVKDLLKVYTTSMSNGLTVCSYEHKNNIFTGSFLYVNNALEKIYLYPKEKFLNKNGFNFWLNCCVHPEDRKKETEYYTKCNWPKTRKLRIICSDGSVKWIEETMSFVNYQNKECSICEVKDVTGQIKIEDIRLNIAKVLYDKGIDTNIIQQATQIDLNKTI